MAYRDQQSNVPLFILKLWNLVNDDTDIIHWATDGESFIIESPSDFCSDTIPLYFKHKSLSSFIRQLNMYGFHKVTPNDGGSLRNDAVQIQFAHPCFQRNRRDMLPKIKRKLSVPKTQSVDDTLLAAILSEIQDSRSQQQELREMYEEHARKTAACEQTLMHLSHKLNKFTDVLKSLAKMVIDNIKPMSKRGFQQLALEEGTGTNTLDLDRCLSDQYTSSNISHGPIIHEVTEHIDQNKPGFLDEIFTTNNASDKALAETFIPNNRCLMPPDNQVVNVPMENFNPTPVVHSPDGTLLHEATDELIPVCPSDVMPGIATNKSLPSKTIVSPPIAFNPAKKRPSSKRDEVLIKIPGGELKTIKLQSRPASSSTTSTIPASLPTQNTSTFTGPVGYGDGQLSPALLNQLEPTKPYSGNDSMLSMAQFNHQLEEQEKKLGQISTLIKNMPAPSAPITLPMDEYNNLFAELNMAMEPFGNEVTFYDPESTAGKASSSDPRSPPQKKLKLSTDAPPVDEGLQTPQILMDDILK